jgi:hypothetical protein
MLTDEMIADGNLSPAGKQFKLANRHSPVIAGSVIGNGGQGARYTLANRKTYTLTADDCTAIEPRWQL